MADNNSNNGAGAGSGPSRPHSTMDGLHTAVQDRIAVGEIWKNFQHFTQAGAHAAGQNPELTEWTRRRLEESGFETRVEEYKVWLNRPQSHRVALLGRDGAAATELKLDEPPLKDVPESGRSDRPPTYHGFSASGTARGQLVYANYGRRKDFEVLAKRGVDVRGKIVLMRSGRLFRGLKVKFAEERGAAAALLYSDSGDDGDINEEEFLVFPEGPARHPDSVERGTVLDIAQAPGDPTTPGWASLPGDDTRRVKPPPGVLPTIPSIPLSMNDARPLFELLAKSLPKADSNKANDDDDNDDDDEMEDDNEETNYSYDEMSASDEDSNSIGDVGDESTLPRHWTGGLSDVTYAVGPSPADEPVLVESEQDYGFHSIYNVIARLAGESDEEVLVGNHRDAWTPGATDPNSGSAIVLEVARALGEHAKQQGWKPKRTLVVASWDGGDYGLLGSTEWGEQYAKHLSEKAVAYLNTDGIMGSNMMISANALLQRVVAASVEATPVEDETLSQRWGREEKDRQLTALGAGSDYAVFQEHLGIPSLDVHFYATRGFAVHPYHSNYDGERWCENENDWGEKRYHLAVTRFLARLAVELVAGEVIPFSATEYARSVQSRLRTLAAEYKGSVDMSALTSAAAHFAESAARFDERAERAAGSSDSAALAKINAKLLQLDRKLLHADGLDSRPWFRHILYAPARYDGYRGQRLPGISESIEDNDDERLARWVDITKNAVEAASDHLKQE